MGTSLTEIRADGSTSTFTTVPVGKALVITDVQCVWVGLPGDAVACGLCLWQPNGGNFVDLFEVDDRLDTNGSASRATSMTTGITFGPGLQLAFIGYLVYAHGYYVDAP